MEEMVEQEVLIERVEALHNKEVNCYAVIDGNLVFKALGDRVILKEDEYRTGLECKTCGGSSSSEEDCTWCKATGTEEAEDYTGAKTTYPCRICHGKKKKPCQDCKGKGGLIIAPEETERRPTSGVVVSIGPDVKMLKVGDRVAYNNYSGTAIEFKQKAVIRILHEEEIAVLLFGTGELGDKIK